MTIFTGFAIFLLVVFLGVFYGYAVYYYKKYNELKDKCK